MSTFKLTSFHITMREIIAGTLIIALALYFAFVTVVEPTVSRGQVSETFITSLTVTDQIAFQVSPADITMSGPLSGLTGGTSNGQTYFAISSNNASGYNVTLTASSSNMEGINAAGNIPFLVASSSGAEPTYDFDSTVQAVNTAGFGYTIEASSSLDLDQSFQNDGDNNCNAGSTQTTDKCWAKASTTAFTVVNRSTSTPSGGIGTDVKFRVVIQPNPAPAIPNDTYRATTTLTATEN